MTDGMPSVSLDLMKVVVGGYVTFGIDARALHSALAARNGFPDWILVGIEIHNYLKNQDFVLRRQPGDDQKLDYVVTLDMAKGLALLEPPSTSRTAVRQFLLDAERKTVFATVRDQRPTFDRPVEEISFITVRELVKSELRTVMAELIGDKRFQSRYGKTAGQIWKDKGWPSLRLDCWFSNLLKGEGCLVDGCAYGELGHARARLFDPDKVNRWLASGGLRTVEMKIAERLGQGSFKFVFQGRVA